MYTHKYLIIIVIIMIMIMIRPIDVNNQYLRS